MTRTGVVSLESKRKHPLIKIVDFELFVACCQQRERYDEQGAAREAWTQLAAKFQEAKGARYSYMAEYCMKRAAPTAESVNKDFHIYPSGGKVTPHPTGTPEP